MSLVTFQRRAEQRWQFSLRTIGRTMSWNNLIRIFSLLAFFSYLLQGTSIGQTPLDESRDRLQQVMLGRFDELARQVRTGRAPGRGLAISHIGQTKWPDAQAEQAAQLLCDVLECPDPIDRECAAEAIQDFAQNNSDHAAKCIRALVKAIPNASDGELVEIVGALAEIGPAAASALPSLRRVQQDDRHRIVRIHTAAAQLRLDPEDELSLDLLVDNLANKDAAYRWRAADALRSVGSPAKRATETLRRLLSDDDPRVRVTAASAIFAIDGDAESALPVLIRSLREPDRALATKFIYPSFYGESHRAYAAMTLAEIGPKAVEAVPALMETIKEVAVDLDEIPPYMAGVGFSAVEALGRIGPAARESLPMLRAVKSVKHSWVDLSPHVVDTAIARIDDRDSRVKVRESRECP